MEEKQIANSSLGQTPPPRQRLEFAYDSQSRRIRKVVKTFNPQTSSFSLVSDLRFVYDAWNMIAEFSLQNSALVLQRSYAWGYDLSGSEQGAGGVGGLVLVSSPSSILNSPSSSTLAPCYDGNGNILAYLDCATGTVTQRMEYDAFGNEMTMDSVLTGNNTFVREVPFRFSTKYADTETNLSYYGYRYYSAEFGRWLSRDPIGEEGGLNLYGMVTNDPVNRVDVFGLAGCCTKAKLDEGADSLQNQADTIAPSTTGFTCIDTADTTFTALRIPACWMCRVECRSKLNLKSGATPAQIAAAILLSNPLTTWGRSVGLNHCVVMCMGQDDEGYVHEVMIDNWQYPSHKDDSPDAFRNKFPYLQDEDHEPYGSSEWVSGDWTSGG